MSHCLPTKDNVLLPPNYHVMPITYNLTMSSSQAAQENHTKQSVSGNSTEELSDDGNVTRQNMTAIERFHDEFDAALNGQVVECAVCSRKRTSVVCAMYYSESLFLLTGVMLSQ